MVPWKGPTICHRYSCHSVFVQCTEDDCVPSEQLFSIFLHTFVHVWPHLLLAACCSNTFGSRGYLFWRPSQWHQTSSIILFTTNILRDKRTLLSLFYRLQNEAQINVKSSAISGANFISDMIFPSAQYQTTFHTFTAQTVIIFSCSCKPSAFLHISP